MSSPLVVPCILAVLFGGGHTSTIPHANFDVIVYGGTPSGIMAAISAARTAVHTPKVLLLEPSPYRVGGMTAGGLGHTDLGVGGREIGGFVAEFYARVSSYYTSAEPTADQQCYNVESHVAEQVYTAMLNSSGVVVQLGEMLSQVKKENARIVAISMISGKTFEGSVFIDATYEGDLMALAGVSYTVGREASSQYSEESGGRLAPNDVLARYQFQVPVNGRSSNPKQGLLPMVYGGEVAAVGAADQKVQAYCFRPCMTKFSGGGAVPVLTPRKYNPAHWQLVRNLFASNAHRTFHASDFAYFAGPLGNSTGNSSKYDVGTSGPINLDVVGESWAYPDANATRRAAIVERHVEHTLGFLHFMSTDPAVPATLKQEFQEWGFCGDEFEEEEHFPRSSLYVREARRMVGDTVFTEKDRVSSVQKDDTIGVGSYNCDVHMVETIEQRVNGTLWVLNEGWLTHDFPHVPFEMPFSLMLPRAAEALNLLVPVAVSASHVAFGAIRLEVTWSILGAAAGAAASLAASKYGSPADGGADVHSINVQELQRILSEHGQYLNASALRATPPRQVCS